MGAALKRDLGFTTLTHTWREGIYAVVQKQSVAHGCCIITSPACVLASSRLHLELCLTSTGMAGVWVWLQDSCRSVQTVWLVLRIAILVWSRFHKG